MDDFKPYLYKTDDYGKSWKLIVEGIHDKHFTRVIRADPDRKGLLYAGTENGMYVSMNDGANWQSFQLNLPTVPITDLAIKNQDLVVATQGRSFWVLDDLTPLHQWTDQVSSKSVHFFAPRPVYRGGRGASLTLRTYFEKVPKEKVSLSIYDQEGKVVTTFSTKPDRKKKESPLRLKAGMNSTRWDLRYPGAERFEGMILWGGGTQGPRAVPGTYSAKLQVGEQTREIKFEIKMDPRSSSSIKDLKAQFEFHSTLRDKLSVVHLAIKKIRNARGQIQQLQSKIRGKDQFKELAKQADGVVKALTQVEEKLYQTKNQSAQDPLNFPIRLNNRLSALVSVVGHG